MQINALYPDHLQPVSDPFPIFTFDFASPPDESGREAEIQVILTPTGARSCSRLGKPESHLFQVPASKDGAVVHALVVWWTLDLTGDGAVLLSTAPAWTGMPQALPLP